MSTTTYLTPPPPPLLPPPSSPCSLASMTTSTGRAREDRRGQWGGKWKRGMSARACGTFFLLLFFVLSTNPMFSLLRILTMCHHPHPLTTPMAALKPSWAQMMMDVVGAQGMFFNAFSSFFVSSTNLFFPSLGSIYILMRWLWDTTHLTPPLWTTAHGVGMGATSKQQDNSNAATKPNGMTMGWLDDWRQGGNNEEAKQMKKGPRDVVWHLLGPW